VAENGPVPRKDGFPNWGKQLDAIGAQVLTLPADTRILPGHGEELTVAVAEKRFNSWVAAGQDLGSVDGGFGSVDLDGAE
jgi:glyoxylase-like metal-dependent hydrolase (beta-lactamase superfamily II)